MRTLALLFWLLPFAHAQDDADRAAIRAVIASLNDHVAGATTALTIERAFTADADIWMPSGRVTLSGPLSQPRRIWSEVTAPRISGETIRFLSAEIAIVDADVVQYGSVIVRTSTPVLLVMKKEGAAWRIASYRLSPCGPVGAALP